MKTTKNDSTAEIENIFIKAGLDVESDETAAQMLKEISEVLTHQHESDIQAFEEMLVDDVDEGYPPLATYARNNLRAELRQKLREMR